MNFKRPANLRLEKDKYILDFESQSIDISYIGWISEDIDRILDHLPRNYKPSSEEDYKHIIESGGSCYLETKEVRNLAKEWSGSAINSYTTVDPIYREEIALIEKKMILHFHKEEKNDEPNEMVQKLD